MAEPWVSPVDTTDWRHPDYAGAYGGVCRRPDRPVVVRASGSGGSIEVLHSNEWVSLLRVRAPERGVDGYVYSRETRCAGRIVAVLPYRVVTSPTGAAWLEYLVKSEMTPCWGLDQVLSAVTGGYEGGDIEDDAVREVLEETGYTITRDELIPLGESYASKSSDTVYSLFSVDLTGRDAGEAVGDGSRVESESAAVWLPADKLSAVRDPQVAVMCVRLWWAMTPGTKKQRAWWATWLALVEKHLVHGDYDVPDPPDRTEVSG